MTTQPNEEIEKKTNEQRMEEFLQQMDEIDDSILEQIKEIAKSAEKCHNIDKNDLDMEAVRAISDMHRYNTMLAEHRANLATLSRKKDVIHGDLYEKYSRNSQVRLETKYEVEEWINRNPKWQKIVSYYNNQKILVDYLQDIVKALHTKTFAIKYIIENKKIELR